VSYKQQGTSLFGLVAQTLILITPAKLELNEIILLIRFIFSQSSHWFGFVLAGLQSHDFWHFDCFSDDR